MVATFVQNMATDDVEDTEYVAEPGGDYQCCDAGDPVATWWRGAPARYFASGAAVRRAVLVGMFVNAFARDCECRIVVLGRRRNPVASDAGWCETGGSVANCGNLAGLLWLVAFFATVLGRRGLGELWSWWSMVDRAFVLALWVSVMVNILLVLALLAFHRDAPAVSHRPWVIAFGSGSS
jgi:hypothetical protein